MFTSANEGVANSSGRTDAIIAPWLVDAVGMGSAWVVDCDTLIDVSANSIGLQLKSPGTYAEALLVSHVNAVLVLRTGICGCAVPAG